MNSARTRDYITMDTDSAKSGSRAFSWREAGGGGRSHILPYAGGERQYMGKSISHSPVLGSIVGKSRSFEPTHDPRWRSFTEEQAKVFELAFPVSVSRLRPLLGEALQRSVILKH